MSILGLSLKGRSTEFVALSKQKQQKGAVLLVGLVILVVLMTAATMGAKSTITMEQVSANMLNKNDADNASESAVIMALNDEAAILDLITEARTSGQVVEDTFTYTPPGSGTRTADAKVEVTLIPTVGFSVDELTTFYIKVHSDTEVNGTKSGVTQGFLRLSVSES